MNEDPLVIAERLLALCRKQEEQIKTCLRLLDEAQEEVREAQEGWQKSQEQTQRVLRVG